MNVSMIGERSSRVQNKTTGRFTLPSQSGMEKETLQLAEKWGADTIRDSDGTVLPPEITELDFTILSTLCMIRADQEWNNAHRDQFQQKYLMSDPLTAESENLTVELMAGYSIDQFELDTIHDAKKYWEAIDRTTGEVVDAEQWSFCAESGTVTISGTVPWHVYTVSFLVYQIWETTSMYNYITNDWTGPHQSGIDPYQPEARKHLLGFLDKWIDEHPNTDIVRFTSVAYQFPMVHNDKGETRYMGWSGYRDCISVRALDDFEKKKGYRLRPEDLVDAGYYNATMRPPCPAFRDWIDFVNEFTTEIAAEWVRLVHSRGKKAIMFFCDHWIGIEPYGERFASIGFDGLVIPSINGNELRRIADTPCSITKEVRLYPYFFPVNLMNEPLFEGEGGDPVGESQRYWQWVRRAMLRKCVDRIGYGGYLELAVKFPEFLDAIEVVANEFRQISDASAQGAPYTLPGKVVILNAWGRLRGWMQLEDWPAGELMEAMSGLPIDIDFISFDELKGDGIPEGTSILINYGPLGSAWSGGAYWADPEVVTAVREFVANGGGFMGVGDPTAVEHQGRFLQLEDVMGVQRATSATECNKITPKGTRPAGHFITADVDGDLFLGSFEGKTFAAQPDVEVLAEHEGSVGLAAHTFGKGRSIYLAGIKSAPQNTRVLLRALYWVSNQEDAYGRWTTSNPNTECSAFIEAGVCAVTNNLAEPQKTTLLDGDGKPRELDLKPNELLWVDI